MNADVGIRDALPGDAAAIETLYADAFPDEDLLPLVRDLRDAGPGIVSFVACVGETLAGHVAFTICAVDDRPESVALLGPLAVAPAHQRRGIGSRLMHAGLQRMEAAGAARVLVLGDPAYYGRFGFRADARIPTPYPLPEQWHSGWQSLDFGDVDPALAGPLDLPPLWRHEALWTA